MLRTDNVLYLRQLANGDLEDHAEFALASGAEFLKEFGVNGGNAMVAFKPWDGKTAAHEDDFRLEKLQLVAYKNLYPDLAVFST